MNIVSSWNSRINKETLFYEDLGVCWFYCEKNPDNSKDQDLDNIDQLLTNLRIIPILRMLSK